MSNDNRTRNPREPIGNDPNESSTEAYPSITNSLTGPNPNIAPPNQSMNLDASAAMASVLECMTLQQSTYHIPQFDGKNPPLKEFLQDIANGAVYITESTEPGFIKVVLSKLKGVARESVRDKRFNRVNDLMAHLKKRFAPSKKYQWYFESIVNLRMKQTETVSDYYDRVQGLLSGAKHAIEDKYTQVHYAGTPHEISESTIMMKPVVDCALDAFIRGLPDEMSTFVDTRNPRDLGEALEHALHIEERLRQTERVRPFASSYHIMRQNEKIPERARSPSPYTRQMVKPDKAERTKGEASPEVSNLRNPTSPHQPFHQYPPQYPSYPPQFPYSYAPPYPPTYQYPYSYPPLPPMPQYPSEAPNRNGHGSNQPWRGYGRPPGAMTPPRSTSPGPPENLNSQQVRRSDAATNQPHRERPKAVHFQESSVGSFEQDPKPKTHP